MRAHQVDACSTMLSRCTSAFVLVVALSSTTAHATTSLFSQVPSAPASCNTCHSNGPGTARNVFGLDVEAHYTGTPASATLDWFTVCAHDADGDGVTNGAELGDPCCVWTPGMPVPSSTIGNPADDAVRVGDACVDGGVVVAIDPAWTCPPAWFGGGDGCDCGCGAVDSDCDDATIAGCDTNGCATAGFVPDAQDPVECVSAADGGVTGDAGVVVPPEWTCLPAFFGGDDGCDCGCGVGDPDCTRSGIDQCDTNSCPNAAAGDVPDPDDETSCIASVPSLWTCPADWYGTGDGCDCGCGVLDDDCASASVHACAANGCSDAGEVPDPDEPTRCIADDGDDARVCACASTTADSPAKAMLIAVALLVGAHRRRRPGSQPSASRDRTHETASAEVVDQDR